MWAVEVGGWVVGSGFGDRGSGRGGGGENLHLTCVVLAVVGVSSGLVVWARSDWLVCG